MAQVAAYFCLDPRKGICEALDWALILFVPTCSLSGDRSIGTEQLRDHDLRGYDIPYLLGVMCSIRIAILQPRTKSVLRVIPLLFAAVV